MLVKLNHRTFQDIKTLISKTGPGPNTFPRTFQVLEILGKIQDFPGGMGTLLMLCWQLCHITCHKVLLSYLLNYVICSFRRLLACFLECIQSIQLFTKSGSTFIFSNSYCKIVSQSSGRKSSTSPHVSDQNFISETQHVEFWEVTLWSKLHDMRFDTIMTSSKH